VDHIKQFRIKYKLTRKELARLMGVSLNTIYLWETGRRNPSKTAQILLSKIQQELEEKTQLKRKEVKKHGEGNL
jgi:DNA-binding transcriptional regulator YiaG